MPRQKNISDEVILDAARDVFLDDGVGASTIKIAAKAGVSEGVLFQRYGQKKALFFKAMRLPAPDFTDAIQASNRCDQHLEALLVLVTSALDYLRSVMPIVLLVLSHPSRQEVFQAHTGQAHELLFEAFGISEIFKEFFEKQVNRGRLRERDYTTVTGILFSTLLTRALHEQIGLDHKKSAQAWLKTVVKVLID
ncbi:MAG: TetR/AcrR family transcriptional regulator [Gammaproteobacteria bacterium]|nr:TetR/AcrR family transcriptional regulator [Gammaproteobacteria bacterium]